MRIPTLSTRRRATHHASGKLMLPALSMAVAVVTMREVLCFAAGARIPTRAKRGLRLRADAVMDSTQMAPDDTLAVFRDIRLPLLIIAGSLLARSLLSLLFCFSLRLLLCFALKFLSC